MKKSDVTRVQRLEEDSGETLTERLGRGVLPVAVALGLGAKIAAELGAAHEAGNVHRNLNPSTIRVTADGDVKITDFAPDEGAVPETSAYLSPEQVRDEAAGSAADIWAFGCVLFEMLTGHGPFDGETESDRVASILKSEPDWSLLPSGLDPRVRFLLERCLDKFAASRSSDLRGVAAELEKVLAQPEDLAASRKARWLPWAAVFVVSVLVAGLVGWTFSATEDSTVVEFEILPATTVDEAFLALVPELGISADGARTTFRGLDGALYIRDRDDAAARRVEFTEPTGALWEPLLSADGQDLFYVDVANLDMAAIGVPQGLLGALTVLARVAAISDAPGLAQSIADAAGSSGAVSLRTVSADGGSTTLLSSWPQNVIDLSLSDDGELLFTDAAGSVLTVPPSGGSPTVLLEGVGARYPQLLPGGDYVLYSTGSSLPEKFGALRAVGRTVTANGQGIEIVVQSVSDPDDRRVVWAGGLRPRFVPETGHIVYLGTEEPGLWAFPFDLETLEKTGDPVPMVDGIVVDFDASASGALVYALATGIDLDQSLVSADGSVNDTLGVFDMEGELVRPLRVNPGTYSNPRVSPGGTRVAYEFVNASGSHIWIYDLVADLPRQLTTVGTNIHPVWKDDATLTFASRRDETWGIYTQSLGDDEADLLLSATGNQWWRPQAWSPDGTLIFVEGGEDPRTGRLMMLAPDSEPTEVPPSEPGASEFGAVLSPDGSVLVHMKTPCASFPGCVRAGPFPPVRGSSYEVAAGRSWVSFSPDGAELFTGASAEALAVMEVIPDTIRFTDSRRINFGNGIARLDRRGFDLGFFDGEQFLVGIVDPDAAAAAASTPDGAAEPDVPVSLQIDYVHNFFELLEQRVQRVNSQ